MRAPAVVTCAAIVSITVAPAIAAGQNRQAFARATIDLARALDGTYGDEGPAVTAALESMADALAAWDRELRRRESEIPPSVDEASARGIAGMHTALGWAYFERGRASDALREFDRAIQLEPRDAVPHLLRGRVHVTDELAQAEPAFRRAWELDRGDPVKAYWLVQSAMAAGRTDRLQDALDALASRYRRLAAGEESGRAAPFLTRALFRDDAVEAPMFPLVAYQDGFARVARGEYDRALASLREAAASDPLVADEALRAEPMRRGFATLRAGRAAEALLQFERAFEQTPPSSEVHRVLGIASRAAGRFDESLAHLETAIRLNPHDERARLQLVTALRDAGDLPRAEDALQEAIHVFPGSGALRWAYAMLYHQVNRKEEMLQQLEALPTASILAGRGRVLATIGRLHLEGTRTGAAVRPFRLGVLTDPNNPDAHLDLGNVYRAEGHTGPALAAFVAAALIAPDAGDAHTAVGQIHLATGEFDDAVLALRRAVALQPEEADAHYGLARALLRLGQAREAAEHFETFRRLQRARLAAMRRTYAVAALTREAALHEDAGRHDAAAAAWTAVIEQEPHNLAHHVALAEALVRSGRLAAALAHLERAATPDAAPGVYQRLAELYAALGRPDESARAHAAYERRRAETLQRANGR